MQTKTSGDTMDLTIENPRDAENLYYYLLHQQSQAELYDHSKAMWFKNLGLNLPHTKKGLRDIPKDERPAIVVAAGPSHKKINFDSLKKFTGNVIATNKSFKTLVAHGIRPDWVVALDAETVMLKSFVFHGAKNAIKGQKFYLGTVIDPSTTKRLLKFGGDIYWGNPEMPGVQNAEEIMRYINGLGSLRHGGNAGVMGIWLAHQLGSKNIGVLGMDLGVRPSRKWARDFASIHKYFWLPEQGITLAVDPVFRVYLGEFSRAVHDAYKEGTHIQNLTHGSLLAVSLLWPTRTLEEFIDDPHTEFCYFEGIIPRE